MWGPAFRKHLIKNSYTYISCVSSCNPLQFVFITKGKIRIPLASYLYFRTKVTDADFCLAWDRPHWRMSYQLRNGRFLVTRESERVFEAPGACSFWHLSTSVKRKAVWLKKKISCITFGKKREMSLPWHSSLSQKQAETSLASRKVLVLFCQPQPLGASWWN